MRRLRLFLAAFGLALSLAIGQQAVLEHALRHAVEDLASHDSLPSPSTCDQHSLFASAASAVGGEPPVAPYVAAVLPTGDDLDAPGVDLAARRSFLSRAPPASLA